MKERPILFSGKMVRAIRDEKKTQTRRIIKPAITRVEWNREPGWCWVYSNPLKTKSQYTNSYSKDWPQTLLPFCPYGEIGDRLWVRETWQSYMDVTGDPDLHRFENCKTDPATGKKYIVYYRSMYNEDDDPGDWSPSIHMPRWASRITLEITDIHAEQLRDISEEDARAEGAVYAYTEAFKREHGHYPAGIIDASCAVGQFASLWDSINADRGYSWESNPWVWVIGFKPVQGGQP